MWLAALRRFLVLAVSVSAATAAVSLLVGLALRSSSGRAVSLGFYCIGAFAMVVGVFVGSRGPMRLKSEEAAPSVLPFLFFGDRRLRWASLSEQHETINNSAVFVAVGFVLLVMGILVDPRTRVF